MPEPFTAYRCRFHCGKVGTKKNRIAEHEEKCIRHPAKRACISCDSNNGRECVDGGFPLTGEEAFPLQMRCRHYRNEKEGVEAILPFPDEWDFNEFIRRHEQFVLLPSMLTPEEAAMPKDGIPF